MSSYLCGTTLVSVVDIWDRWLSKTIPNEAVPLLDHSDEKLVPLYVDLQEQSDRLSEQLKE